MYRRSPPPPMLAETVTGGIQTPLKGEKYSQNYRRLLTSLLTVFYHNKWNAELTWYYSLSSFSMGQWVYCTFNPFTFIRNKRRVISSEGFSLPLKRKRRAFIKPVSHHKNQDGGCKEIQVYFSLRQFWVNDVWTLRGQESPLMKKKGL